LVIKGNQKQLLQDIEEKFEFRKNLSTYKDVDLEIGRIETRKFSLISNFQFIT